MNLEPGPELDAMVAKALRLNSVTTIDGRFFISGVDKCHLAGKGDCNHHSALACYPWSPSTDANAALEAAEWAGLLDHYYLCGANGAWDFVDFSERPMWLEGCKTLPHAICLAILKAKEQP